MHVTYATSLGMIDLNSIPKKTTPYTIIPSYVFGNFNQVTNYNFTVGELEAIRLKAATVTPIDLEKEEPNIEARIPLGEKYDWIYGLGELEKYLSDQTFLENPAAAFTTDDIIRINGLFSRLCTTNGHIAGAFRNSPIFWRKKDLNPTGNIARGILEIKILEMYGEKAALAFCSQISNPNGSLPTCPIKASWLRQRLTDFQQGRDVAKTENGRTYKKSEIHPEIINEWLQQFGCNEKGKVPKLKKGTEYKYIDVARWIKAHLHFFPMQEEIVPELRKTLQTIQDPKKHPIEIIAGIWYDIVKIHISHEANKRCGKAIGSLIALAFGYLPPKIGEEDCKEYIQTMEKGFEKENGHIAFTNFIARKMNDAYKEYGALFENIAVEEHPVIN